MTTQPKTFDTLEALNRFFDKAEAKARKEFYRQRRRLFLRYLHEIRFLKESRRKAAIRLEEGDNIDKEH